MKQVWASSPLLRTIHGILLLLAPLPLTLCKRRILLVSNLQIGSYQLNTPLFCMYSYIFIFPRYNSPLPEIASPFPYPSTVPIRASGYQHRGGMGSFPNYPTPVSPHTSLNNYSYNHDTCGIISPSQTQTRDTLSPYLGHQRIGRDANSTERDSPLFQMSPQPRTPSRPPLSAYQVGTIKPIIGNSLPTILPSISQVYKNLAYSKWI